MKTIAGMALMILALVFAGCGGGGGGSAGAGGAVSGQVPYLISGPSVTFSTHPTVTTSYSVTVTIEADGPTGVKSAGLWIFDETDSSNFTHLDLANTPGTKRWTGATNAFLPLTAGAYYIDDIVLDDEIAPADPLRTGWYFIMPPISTSAYYVDERITTGTSFLYYGGGLSSRPVTRFTLP